MADKKPPGLGEFDGSHVGNQRRQRRMGLQMTPAERLAWLEEMLDELLPLVGRARNPSKKTEKPRT